MEIIYGIGLLGIGYYTYKNYEKIKFILKFAKNFTEESLSKDNELTLDYNDKYFKVNGFVMPYDDSKSVEMQFIEVLGIDYEDQEHNLTHIKPGIPYMFSCDMIGMKKINVKNNLNDQNEEYTGHQILGYCENVF